MDPSEAFGHSAVSPVRFQGWEGRHGHHRVVAPLGGWRGWGVDG